jgi:hypothetical protein
MNELPAPFAHVHRTLAAATLRHEYLGTIYRDVVDERTAAAALELLRHSARIATHQLPTLVKPMRDLEHMWLDVGRP